MHLGFINMHSTVMLLFYSCLALFFHATLGTGQQAAGQQTAGVNRAGVSFRTFSDKLPSPEESVSLIKSLHTQRVRLYSPDYPILEALRNSGNEVVVGVGNDQLKTIASGQDKANEWVRINIKNFPEINFRYIVVGNGVSPLNEYNGAFFSSDLVQAMENIQTAISSVGLQDKIKVTTALDHSVVLTQIHPPSKAEFNPKSKPYFTDRILQFLKKNSAPFLVNLQPYFSYAFNKPEIPQKLNKDLSQTSRDIRLEYANFRSPSILVQDGQIGYQNVFDAMVDAVYYALEKAGASELDVVVSQSGWPTAGGPGATEDSAGTYNGNLIKHIMRNGTPKRPAKPVETYIYNLFDENLRSREIDKHWGIIEINKNTKYPISFWSPNE